MSLVKASNIQIGQDVSATNNFVLSAPANGTLAIGVGNSGSQTTVLTVSAGGVLTLPGNAVLGTNTGNSHTINGTISLTNNLTVANTITTTVGAITAKTNLIAGGGSTGGRIYPYFASATNYNAILAEANGDMAFESGVGSPVKRFNIGNNGDFSRVIPGGSVLYPDFACRAWVNFNGTGANGNQSIRGSGNVSSVVKTGAGLYTANFATAMPDANYCLQGTSNRSDGAEPDIMGNDSTAQTATACFLRNTSNAGSPRDVLFGHASFHR